MCVNEGQEAKIGLIRRVPFVPSFLELEHLYKLMNHLTNAAAVCALCDDVGGEIGV